MQGSERCPRPGWCSPAEPAQGPSCRSRVFCSPPTALFGRCLLSSRCSLQTMHELPTPPRQNQGIGQGECPLGPGWAPGQQRPRRLSVLTLGLHWAWNVCTREPPPHPPPPGSCASPGRSPGRSPETQSNFESGTKAAMEQLRTWAGGHGTGGTLAGTPPAPGAGLPTLSQAASR